MSTLKASANATIFGVDCDIVHRESFSLIFRLNCCCLILIFISQIERAMISSLKKIILPLFMSLTVCGGITSGWAQSISLSAQKLKPVNVTLEETSYKGKKAIRVIPTTTDRESIAIIKDKIIENV